MWAPRAPADAPRPVLVWLHGGPHCLGTAAQAIPAMRFTANHGQPTKAYPFNPNGSPGGLTAVTTPDGRFTAMMPHPERVFRNIQMSWTDVGASGGQAALSPWMHLWRNARKWVG